METSSPDLDRLTNPNGLNNTMKDDGEPPPIQVPTLPEEAMTDFLALKREAPDASTSTLATNDDGTGLVVSEEPSPKRAKTIAAAVAAQNKVNEENWMAMFEKLVAYKQQYGDCLVPKRYPADPRLGTWVETQRGQYKRLQKAVDEQSGVEAVTPNKRLNQERLAKLESIGFAWTAKNIRKPKSPVTTPQGASPPKAKKKPGSGEERTAAKNRSTDEQWREMYLRLKKYREEHGHCLVPRKYEQDPKLAVWVDTQRAMWNRDFREEALAKRKAAVDSGLFDPNVDASGVPLQKPSKNSVAYPAEMTGQDGAGNTQVVCQDMQPGNGSVPGEITTGDAAPSGTPRSGNDAATMSMLPEYDPAPAPIELSTVQAAEDNASGDVGPSMVECAAWGSTDGSASVEEYGYAEPSTSQDPVLRLADVLEVDPAVVVANLPQKRMSQERKDKLDELGFVWSLRTKRIDDHWDEMFRQLEEYRDKHGDCLVPSRYEENLKLGKWTETQRYEYTKLQRAAEQQASGSASDCAKPRPTNPRLTEERLRRLESIGFEWKVKNKMKRYYDRLWNDMFTQLKAYREEHGHCMVPKRYPPNMKLGTWVHTQRIQYRKLMNGTAKKGGDASEFVESGEIKIEEEVSYRLTEERRAKLEEIGFIWSAREGERADAGKVTRNTYDSQWDLMFEKLKQYKEKHGNCLVPKRYREDPKLGCWIDTQRVQYKKLKKKLAEQGQQATGTPPADQQESNPASAKPVPGRLTEERIRRLEDLGFVWSLRDDWQKHYEELVVYKNENGHCNVPARWAPNRRLGIWVSAQRQQYKIQKMPEDPSKPKRSSPLTQERIALLNELGFTWTVRSRENAGDTFIRQPAYDAAGILHYDSFDTTDRASSVGDDSGLEVYGQREQI